jgi:hypothetical protein
LAVASLVTLKLAWRKISALLAAGRAGEDIAATFAFATLFDHYCARIHVGAALDAERAAALRTIIQATVRDAQLTTLVGVFRHGAAVLARGVLEAPRFISSRLAALAERWVTTRGNAEATVDLSFADSDQWLDRAACAVAKDLDKVDPAYLTNLVADFENLWRRTIDSTGARI